MTCPNCGVAVPPGSRFCSSCGTALAVTLLEERRIVTVLFADVVGYTALAEHRDPETVKRIIDGCLQRLVADVVAFGGRVDKLLGDGVLALFGAPVAHEDDAERAVRAALRMQATLRGHSAGTPSPLQLRVGINTGEVLVGALRAGGDYTAMGDVVNTASRLQTSAAPGTVLVGESTFALTESAIRYERYGELQVRGRERPLPAWIALEPVSLPGSHRRRRHSPLVGRDEELGLLLGGLRYAVSRRRSFLAAIDGEGGVGKSRLVEEVVERVREDESIRIFEGSCVPYGESNVWWPLASALSAYLELDPGASESEIRELATSRAAEILDRPLDDPEVERVADGFCHLLNLPSALDEMEPVRARQELTRVVVAAFRARLREGPVMVAITDVHWADPSVLQLFEQVMASLAGLPFLLVTTARPDAELAWPPSSGPYATLRLRLDPLDPAASAELARAILGEGADTSTVARLFERSGGNPLFLEELATLVADTGSTVLPDSLRALVAARLDQLPPDQRALLDNAAVLGTSGPWAALVKFGEETGVEATEEALDALVEAGLLALEGSRWRFRSESVRDVAYQTLTKAARAQRHSGVASAMEEHAKSSIEDIAHHWATAAEIVREIGRVSGVPRDVEERAVRWLTEAAERATDQMYPRTGYRLATRGVDLLEGQDEPAARVERRRLLLIRADAAADLRWLAKSRSDLDAVVETALADDDRRSTASAHRLLGEVERLEGDVDRSRVQFDESLRLWREIGDDPELARALRGRGFVEVFGMTPSGAEPFLDEAEEIYARLNDRGGLAWVEQNRAWASFLSGDVAQAETRLHKAADVMTEIGDRGGLGWAHGLLAYVRYYAGDPEQAMQISQSVLDEARERGDDWAAGIMQALQANLRLWEGRIDEALQVAEQARARLRRLGDGFGEIQALAPMARALAAQGRPGAAMRVEEELDALSAHFGALGIAPMIEAAVAVQLGDTERALAASDECDEIERRRGRDRGAGAHDVTVLRGIALLQAGRLDEALQCLDEAEEMRPGSPFGAAALAFAAVIDRRPDDALALAQQITSTRGATYLDRIYGTIAEAAAHRQRGEAEECRWALDSAATMAGGSSDVIARAIVDLARAALDGGVAPPEEGELALTGWRRLIGALAGEAAPVG